MPATFPTGVALRVPSTRTLEVPTRVVEFLDGSEQRWSCGEPLNSFEIRFDDVVNADLSTLMAFFDTVKGAFDSTWDLVWCDGVTYPGMGFESDEMSAVEGGAAEVYSVSFKARQVARSGAYSDTASAVYPALANGCYTQRPFTAGRKWLTTRNDLESGARFAWYEWAAMKRTWVCEYPVLTLAEVATRISFFIAMRGKLRLFTFNNPRTGADVTNCRFDQSGIVVRCLGGDQWATSLAIVETF